MASTRHVLVAFDFDHTIINDNSDTYIRRLAPNGGKIPSEISQLYSEKGWTKYMAEVFKYLHKNGTMPKQLLSCVAEINFVTGMYDLITYLAPENGAEERPCSTNFDSIIISDSNSVCVQCYDYKFMCYCFIFQSTKVECVFCKIVS